MDQEKRRRIKGIIIQIIAEAMFGFSFMFTKEATSEATPLQLLSWRFMTAAILFLFLIRIGFFKVNYRGKNLKAVLLLGFLHPICYFLCENKGISLTSASETERSSPPSQSLRCLFPDYFFISSRGKTRQPAFSSHSPVY